MVIKFYHLNLKLLKTGNANTVPIIRTIGIGLGMLFWNIVGLITGWGTARYGWLVSFKITLFF